MEELKPCPYSRPQISHAVDRMTLAAINHEPSYLWPVDCYIALWTLKNIVHATPENKALTCDGCRFLPGLENLDEDIRDICWECARYPHPDHYARKPKGSESL